MWPTLGDRDAYLAALGAGGRRRPTLADLGAVAQAHAYFVGAITEWAGGGGRRRPPPGWPR